MVGICGGTVSSDELEQMRSEMISESWYTDTSLTDEPYAISVRHHGTKTSEPTILRDDDINGVVFGTITNQSAVGDHKALFNALIDEPADTLSELTGSFLLVWIHDGVLHIATDCLTSVSCLYREVNDGVVFGNELGAVVAGMDNPHLDVDAAAEFLARDFVFGDRTLVDGVRRIQPATILRVGDEVATERYWHPSYAAEENPSTTESVLKQYRDEVRAATETSHGYPGIFLTGGLDSRLLAGSLKPELETFDTVTFDYNPINKNLKPAKRVADLLGVPNSVERHTPEEFTDIIRKGVRTTNGMVHWRNFFAFPFVFEEARDRFDTLIANFGQGEFFGEYLTPSMLTTDSPTRTLSTDTQKRGSRQFFAEDVDLDRGLREAIDKREEFTARETVHDVFFTSFYPWFHFSKMNVHRSQTDTELVMANPDLLDAATRIPGDMRRRPIDLPIVDTMLPTAPAKYELVKELDGGLEKIPSNSLLALDHSLVLHTLVYNTWRNLPSVSLSKPYFGYQRKAHRYREWLVHNDEFRQFVDDLLESAASRDCFDAARIKDIQSEQHSHPFKSHIEEISAITSLEILIQEFNLEC